MFNQVVAPVPRAELAASLAPFGESRMLPPASYRDPEVFDWEQRTIFAGWLCIGHSKDHAKAGSQRAVSTGEGSILLVRDESGVLRAFANTCRHRGHELVQCGAAVERRSIICPYHSWSYK